VVTLANDPRDLRGYGARPPDARWLGGARLALSFVLNYEEGGESNILNGDEGSEAFLHEMPGKPRLIGRRDPTSESMYAYGSRVGFWRIMRQFADRELPMTVYAVGRALELNPDAAEAMAKAGHEVASHAYRWIDYTDVSEEVEREHIVRCVEVIERLTGTRPVGWFTGRISPNTRRLVVEEGGFLYDSDAFDDDWPYWVEVEGKQHLVIPYAFDSNDQKFHMSPGFVTGEDFYQYLKDAFDTLYAEGAEHPRMMTVGLHCRTIGRPGRAASLARFLDYIHSHDGVWVCRRSEIAEHWRAAHPPPRVAAGAAGNG
jgi:putative urate catabolism protein